VRDNHRRDPLPAGGPDDLHHYLPVSGVEGARWLIGQEQPPPPDERPGDGNPLPLAPGQLLRHDLGWKGRAGPEYRPSLAGGIGAEHILRNYLPREYSWSILSVMSVPLTLLGLLERGPSHGYDLKRDYDAYFGLGKPLRYSQVYATLSRLARDGKAVAGPVEQEAGPERRRYVITDDGVAEVDRWLAEPVPPEPDLQSELFAKVVLALMLDRPADGYLDAQRAAHLQRMRELTDMKRGGDPVGVLLADHSLYRLEADLRWIDHTAARLDLLARAVRR